MSTNNKYDWAGPSLRIDVKRDPYTAVRTTPMKVLCLGMPRTGTMCTRITPISREDSSHRTQDIQLI